MSSDLNDLLMRNDTTTEHTQYSGEAIGGLHKNDNIYMSFMAFISFLVMISNGIVVTVVVYCRDLHLPTLWNIAFMASCDLLYGLHYMIFAFPSLNIGKFAYSDSMIKVASISMTLLFGQNVFNIFLVTVDRYIAVCWPLRYPSLMSAKRILIAVLILAAINFIRMCLIIFPNSTLYYHEELGLCLVNFNSIIIGVASTGLPLLTSVFITVLLILIRMEFRSKNRVHPIGSTSQGTQFTFTMSLAALEYIVCYIPYCVTIVMSVIVGKDNVNIVLLQASIIIVLSNSLWNVVIYATTYKPFRDGFLKLFCRKILREQARREVNTARRDIPTLA